MSYYKCFHCQQKLSCHTLSENGIYYSCDYRCSPFPKYWMPTFITMRNNVIDSYQFITVKNNMWYEISSLKKEKISYLYGISPGDHLVHKTLHKILDISYYYEINEENHQQQFSRLFNRLKHLMPFS